VLLAAWVGRAFVTISLTVSVSTVGSNPFGNSPGSLLALGARYVPWMYQKPAMAFRSASRLIGYAGKSETPSYWKAMSVV
jgi:hypothetical protein